MLKKLRRKFIALNMASIGAVLIVVLISVCYINYQQTLSSVYTQLTFVSNQALSVILQETDTTTPNTDATPELNSDAKIFSNKKSLFFTQRDKFEKDTKAFSGPPRIGTQNEVNVNIPIAVFSINASWKAKEYEDFTTARIDDDVLSEALSYLQNITVSPEGEFSTGQIEHSGLYYAIVKQRDITVVSFADASSTDSWVNLALLLGLTALLVLGIFFLINLFFSKWALKPVQESWDAQKRFVADASHDLKTPLTVIAANQSILLEHPDESVVSQSQWIESTQNEVSQMQDLINDMLTLAKHDEGIAFPMDETIDLGELAEGTALEFESIAFDRQIEIETDICSSVLIKGNKARLTRLVTILIDNACKYANPGTTIRLTLRAENEQAHLSVNNSGMVIPAADIDHIFERFYRADTSRTQASTISDDNTLSQTSSHGLGLAIARAIAEEHNGSICATSSADEGTTFAIRLPLCQ